MKFDEAQWIKIRNYVQAYRYVRDAHDALVEDPINPKNLNLANRAIEFYDTYVPDLLQEMVRDPYIGKLRDLRAEEMSRTHD